MAKVINVKIRDNEEFLNKKNFTPKHDPTIVKKNIPDVGICEKGSVSAEFDGNPEKAFIIKKNIPDEIQEVQMPATTHMLVTVVRNGWSRVPEVGETVTCKKQSSCPLGYKAISVSNPEKTICGYIFVNNNDVLHGTVLDDEKFAILPENFVGVVVEHGAMPQRRGHLMMIAVECPVKDTENTFTVVAPGQTLLATYGSIFTAKKEPRRNGCASVFGVYDGCRKIGIIAPMHRLAIPGTEVISLQDASKYPDTFDVKVVGDGCYDGNARAIRVKCLLHKIPKPATNEEIAAADKKILKKYLAYLLREGECSTRELMLLSDAGKQKKAMLDAKYKEVMQQSVDKMNAYFNLL